jgi:pimeloyl-ACP methyl ester carboxylesterase
MRWILLSGADREPPSAAELASIRCPVLILSGSEDNVISPLSAAEEWKASFTGGEFRS